MRSPVLTTRRLILRMVEEADWPAYRAYRLSPRSTVLAGDDAEVVARRQFDGFAAHWARYSFGRFIIVERASGLAIGHVGPFLAEGHPEREISWTVWSAAHEGKGFASEAAAAVLSYAFATLGWTTAVSYVSPGNLRSARLALRLGAWLDPDAKPPVQYESALVYRHPAPWEAAPAGPAAALASRIGDLVPTLTTGRLRLRAPRNADFATYASIAAASDGNDPMDADTRQSLWLDYAQMVAGWLLRGAGLWSVERLAEGQLIGFLPLNHEPGDPELEIGWFLARQFRGQGYASEAAGAGLDFAFGSLGCQTLVSYIDPANQASAAVAERLGARLEPVLFNGCQVWRHPKPEAR